MTSAARATGECCALRRRRVDLEHGRLDVAESLAEVGGHLYFGPTKTYRRRQVTLPPFLRELLADHLASMPEEADALAFTAPNGGPLRAENFRHRVWLLALEAAGLPRSQRIHGLRHTRAALLKQAELQWMHHCASPAIVGP
ncbi:MAG TPA: tyrosine-type recombinase/integrase [Actinomycetota bacterium]|nr:tyrosine-type recombinase/integrase [Actinomycetota bacterium]